MSELFDKRSFSETKYIVLEDKKSSIKFIYVFESFHVHRDIANHTIKNLKKVDLDCEVVSGGFIQWDKEEETLVTCGRSISCRVDSRPADIKILFEQFNSWYTPVRIPEL
jgi:hypothetical protein